MYALTADLFFAERLERALAELGHAARVIDLSMDGTAAAGAVQEPPADADLAIIDLEAGEPALQQIRAARRNGTPVLAFGPHVDTASRQAAETAGARVVTRSQLTRSFAALVAESLK